MSFFNNSRCGMNPGHIRGNPLRGLNERACIQVKRVFDAGMKQITEENGIIRLVNKRPPNPVSPLVFKSAKSICSHGEIENLAVTRLVERPRFARVQCDVSIPLDVVFFDDDSTECHADSVITMHEDIILHIPEESIIPFSIEAVTSAICPEGRYLSGYEFDVTTCATIILKVVVEAELLVPSYGYWSIPLAQDFSQEVCAAFHELPLFPRNGI